MNFKSILNLTQHENYRGQVFWTGGLLLVFLMIVTILFSESTLSYRNHMVSSLSYSLIDVAITFMSLLIGSQIFIHDFTNRGIAEITIPRGISRAKLLTWRVFSHYLSLLLFCAVFYVFRFLIMSFFLGSAHDPVETHFQMFCFSYLKATLAFSMATLLGIHTKPPIAILAVIGLLAAGHFSSGITSLSGDINPDEALHSPIARALLTFFKIWNPNNLVIEGFENTWEPISSSFFIQRFLWGLFATISFLSVAILSISRKDIDPIHS